MIFQPDEIKLMGSALDEATIILPEVRANGCHEGEVGLAYPRSGGEG